MRIQFNGFAAVAFLAILAGWFFFYPPTPERHRMEALASVWIKEQDGIRRDGQFSIDPLAIEPVDFDRYRLRRLVFNRGGLRPDGHVDVRYTFGERQEHVRLKVASRLLSGWRVLRATGAD